jgi:hypothetical protein
VDENEYLKDIISEKHDKFKSLQKTNTYVNTIIVTNDKRMISNESREHCKPILYYDSSDDFLDEKNEFISNSHIEPDHTSKTSDLNK